MLDYELLERLCKADAPSGFEDEVREIVISEIKNYADNKNNFRLFLNNK
ncbi:MAG: hypothetical protein IIT39_12205 [Clostridia bacterium]|nr:hypothetical protein [Clostridia bacterium]